ncbi:MAG: PA14 domain-containing protein [Chloroflexi bacterium]|nr:PA14 domain-containing protein [Chloroflexota bacterium]
MSRSVACRSVILVLFAVLLAALSPELAQTARAQTSVPVWYGEYYANQNLDGDPAVTRDDSAIDFDWDTGSPDPAIPSDHFSVRWTSTFYFSAGTWSFSATSDDGVRLWVDNVLLIDRWYDQPVTSTTAEIALVAGVHSVRMEYYDDYVNAVARLTYAWIGGVPAGAWWGQYFDNDSLSGDPIFVRYDPLLSFNWGTGSPGSGIPDDYFSIKWDSTQTLPASGNYTIVAAADDGIRVWIDGARVIDSWYDHSTATLTALRWLNLGAHAVHVEYYERTVNANVSVQIVPAGSPVSSAGDIVVDDGGPGWQAGGAIIDLRNAESGFGGHSLWSLNHADTAASYVWARWYAQLPRPGSYQVLAYIPTDIATTMNARYWVFHSGRYDLAPRAQGAYSNQWVSLGTYYFAATGGEFVSLADVTNECSLCTGMVFDAIKFSPR